MNPEELDMQDQKGLERKYEEQLRKQAKGKDEDFSDMVAEHSARQNVSLILFIYLLFWLSFSVNAKFKNKRNHHHHHRHQNRRNIKISSFELLSDNIRQVIILLMTMMSLKMIKHTK